MKYLIALLFIASLSSILIGYFTHSIYSQKFIGFGVVGLFVIVFLGFSTVISLLRRLDFSSSVENINGAGPRVVASIVVLIFGLGFFIQAFLKVYGYLSGSEILNPVELGVFSADIVGSVIWLVSGTLLITRRPSGYLLGWSGLFAVVALNIGLLVYLIVQPFVVDTTFSPIDFLIISIFTIVCFAPFGFFLRDLKKSGTL